MDLENILIDGKQFSKCFQKFYTIEEYKNLKDSLDFKYFVEEIYLTYKGEFQLGCTQSHTNIKETIGYAVLNWYEVMPKNVKTAINKLTKHQSEDAAIVFLDSIRNASKDKDNNIPRHLYPSLRMYGHETRWNTDTAWGRIELNNSALDADYWAWGNEGPCSSSISNDVELMYKCRPEIFKSANSMIILIKQLAITGSVRSYDIVHGGIRIFSPHYCRGYKPHVKAYKKFCQIYASEHNIIKQNKYEFIAEETRHGYNPWDNSHTSSSRTVTYEIFGNNKTEAYEKFKKLVNTKNSHYAKIWFPGTDGRPHQKALPMKYGRLVYKATKKLECY